MLLLLYLYYLKQLKFIYKFGNFFSRWQSISKCKNQWEIYWFAKIWIPDGQTLICNGWLVSIWFWEPHYVTCILSSLLLQTILVSLVQCSNRSQWGFNSLLWCWLKKKNYTLSSLYTQAHNCVKKLFISNYVRLGTFQHHICGNHSWHSLWKSFITFIALWQMVNSKILCL